MAAEWVVYLIRASDDRLYTGITTDMARRWRQHLEGKGAKFFRGRRPAALVWLEAGHDRVSASQREAAIKRLSRMAKLALVAAQAESAEAAGGVALWASALTVAPAVDGSPGTSGERQAAERCSDAE